MATVVVSVDGSEESKAAVRWSGRTYKPEDNVIAVCGVAGAGEFWINLPPFEVDVSTIREQFDHAWCAPLRDAGLHVTTRMLEARHVHALLVVAADEHADFVVIGRPAHSHLIDAALGKGLDHMIRHTPCALVVVPPDA